MNEQKLMLTYNRTIKNYKVQHTSSFLLANIDLLLYHDITITYLLSVNYILMTF